jgi:hypothetical protein
MTRIAVSRRNLLATRAGAVFGPVSLLGPASASANGRAELNERRDRPELERSLGEERLGPSG